MVYYLKIFFKGLIGIGILLIIVWYGYLIDSSEFFTNVLAGIFGMVITIIFIDTLLDYHNEKQRKKQWEKTKSITDRTLNLLMSSISIELSSWLFNSITFFQSTLNELSTRLIQYNSMDYVIELQKKINEKERKIGEKIITDTLKLYDESLKFLNPKDMETNSIIFNKEKFYSEHHITFQHLYLNFIKPNLDRISYDLIPRILEFSKDQKLIDELIKFDDNIHLIDMKINLKFPDSKMRLIKIPFSTNDSKMDQYIYPSIVKIGTSPHTQKKIDLDLIILSRDLIINMKNVYSVFNSSE